MWPLRKNFLVAIWLVPIPPQPCFCFGLVWSNQIAEKMYPEMDIRRTVRFKRKLQDIPYTDITYVMSSYLRSRVYGKRLLAVRGFPIAVVTKIDFSMALRSFGCD